MNVAIKDTVDLIQTGRRGKHRWLYNQIEELDNEKTIIVSCESIREATSINNAVRQAFKGAVDERKLVVQVRKYAENGKYSPTLFITKQN